MISCLLAQAAAPELLPAAWGAAAVGVAFFAFVTLAALAGIKSERHKTAMAHEETIRRLELGLPDPSHDRSWPVALVCTAIGAGVPLVAFGTTLIAFLNLEHLHDIVWIVPGVVSVVSVAVAGGLASKLLRGVRSDRNVSAVVSKPVTDAEAYDFAGRRV